MYDFLYVVNRHHSSKLLSFWENRVFCILATGRQTNRQITKQTNRQTNRWTTLMHSAALAVATGGLKNIKIWQKTIFNMADEIITPCNVARSWHWFRQVTAPCNVACGSGITTVNSPSGSTLQCGRLLRLNDMPWNSPKRPPYWNSTSGFNFDHITAVDMSFCTTLQNFIQIRPPSAEKRT